MISQLIVALRQTQADVTAEEVADIIWLTLIRQQSVGKSSASTEKRLDTSKLVPEKHGDISKSDPPQTERRSYLKESEIPVFLRTSTTNSKLPSSISVPLKVPNPPSLRQPLDLVRSLRPLMRRVPSGMDVTIDEAATVQKIAEERVWMPVNQSVLEPWLELALVIDESESMFIWRHTILELKRLLQHYGAFRDVRIWGLVTNDNGKVRVRPGIGVAAKNQVFRNPQELIDPSNRRLILVITDCVSPMWHSKEFLSTLKVWAEHGPMAIAQMLPEWLWIRTALRYASPVYLYGLEPGVANQKLWVIRRSFGDGSDGKAQKSEIIVPILTLEPKLASVWSQMVAGRGSVWSAGFVFQQEPTLPDKSEKESSGTTDLMPKQRVERFWLNASSLAWRLAGLLTASPVISLPVIRLIQETMLPQSRQVHVAEVLLGGLLEPVVEINANTKPDEIEFRFVDEQVRRELLDPTPVSDMMRVLSKFVAQGRSLDQFIAELQDWDQSGDREIVEKVRPFAMVTAEVLSRKGGRYARRAEELAAKWSKQQLQSIGETKSFKFEVVTVNAQGKIIKREQCQAQYYDEDLGNNITLQMVAIPEGKFMMGSPEGEGSDDERPQHEVTVQPFFMGKYPVTQAQWKAVAALPRIDRDLKPDPSSFKGDNRPVESVSWYDVVEFCARLSKASGKNYRLPSEAEWEYACRAGTDTPFHFGETLTTELANYNGSTYREEPKGEYREETTPVGIFPGNAFGLFDMHGNVYEWCADYLQENYEEAPVDGSAWLKQEEHNENDNRRLLRGGSWGPILRTAVLPTAAGTPRTTTTTTSVFG